MLDKLYEEGYRVFLCGMALGFDMAAAEAVLALRARRQGVRLVAVIPFAGQELRFPKREQLRYERLLAEADERVVLAQHYSRGCYMVRNNYLVDHASVLVAWYNGGVGGTQYTYWRAVNRNLRIECLGYDYIGELWLPFYANDEEI